MSIGAVIINTFKEDNKNENKKIDKRAEFFMAGSGTYSIDWEYGTKIETKTGMLVVYDNGFYNLSEREKFKFQYGWDYKDNAPINITISSENATHLCFDINVVGLDVSKCTELTELFCEHNELASLDVSKNVNLTRLVCTNSNLTRLDLSNNTKLIRLNCSSNNLTAPVLNALFDTLHSNSGTKTIDIRNNPGTDDCDRSIAEKKGWTVLE